jgi:rSAM/selenodomain-associated transferase 1
MKSVLILFAKAPEPGKVKTRLAADLGEVAAAELQQAFLVDLMTRFTRRGIRKVLACAPTQAHPVFEAFASHGWELWEQGTGDLGERLQRAHGRALAEGARSVVFLGSDSPTLPETLVTDAFQRLREIPVVVGPVFDGGYYLVGASNAVTPLFESIPWGTNRVFAETLHKLDRAAVTYSVLPFWYDVDDLVAVKNLAAHLGVPGPYGVIEAPATRGRLSQLGLIHGDSKET